MASLTARARPQQAMKMRSGRPGSLRTRDGPAQPPIRKPAASGTTNAQRTGPNRLRPVRAGALGVRGAARGGFPDRRLGRAIPGPQASGSAAAHLHRLLRPGPRGQARHQRLPLTRAYRPADPADLGATLLDHHVVFRYYRFSICRTVTSAAVGSAPPWMTSSRPQCEGIRRRLRAAIPDPDPAG